MSISAVVKALAQAAVSVSKSKAVGKVAVSAAKASKATKISKLAKSLGKVLTKKSGLGRFSRTLKDINDILNLDFKTPAVRNAIKNKPFLSRALYFYQKEKEDQWKKIFAKINSAERKIEADTIRAFKNGDGIDYKEFATFRDWYANTLSPQEQEFAKNVFKDKFRLIFNSTWILFATFIPYGKNQNLGILSIQIYGQKSERNPSLFYTFIRVPKSVWEKLEDNATGKEFWKSWYSKNRTNRRFLTKKSIHYENRR